MLVSEVMLQQTPVVRVLPVFDEWLSRWPDPADLAADSPADAIRAWGRLGYPRRALRLHAAATAITIEHGGAVPDSVETLLALPGIGEYTARAVAAFAFGARTPVVDTNVRRVLSRVVRGIDEPREPATSGPGPVGRAATGRTGVRGAVLGRRDGTGRARLHGTDTGLRFLPAGGQLPVAARRLTGRYRAKTLSRPGTAPTGRSAAGSLQLLRDSVGPVPRPL